MPVSRAGCPARHTRTCSHGNFACREQYHHCRCRRYGSSSEVRSRTADCGETLDGNAFPIQTSATHSLPIVADTPLHHSSFDTSTGRPQNTLPCLLPYSCCRKCVLEYVSPQNEPLPRHCGASRSRHDQRRIHSTRDTFHYAHEYYTDVATLLPTNRPCALITQHLWPISAKSQ